MLKSWHRTIGLLASVFVLVLTLTGLALMQTDAFDLDSRYIDDDRLLNWYGVRPAPPPLSFRVRDHWLAQLGDRVYFNNRLVTKLDGQLIGAAPLSDELLIATTSDLIVITGDGEVAEKLGPLDDAPRQIGIDTAGNIIVRTAAGNRRYDPLSGELANTAPALSVRWSLEATLPDALSQTLAREFRGSGLSLERVLLDLHTGRLLGSLGVLIVNTASVLLLVLVISGFVMWVRRPR
jgi:hypothetical protein